MPLVATSDVRALERAVVGRYALERELGRGGMGIVVLARDLSLDRPVALKLLPAALAVQPILRERFLREARTAASLSHPHIVPIHAVEAHADIVFIAMAFVDGETLAERVRRAGLLPPREAARILREVAWALAYAHGRGVVHRDIKPENILIERGTGRALVTDFGIARSTRSRGAATGLTIEGQLVGTAEFMSPEQAAGEAVDGRSDIYSLGAVGFHALTGRLPFEAPTVEGLLALRLTRAAQPVASVRADIPPRLAAAVDRCLAREPGDRYATAEGLAEALAESTGPTGAADIALPVRSFLRAAEQTVWLAGAIVVFSLVYGLPATRSLAPLLVGIPIGVGLVSINLLRRARELLAEGFGPADVRRAFEIELRLHAEELRLLFDERRTAARRRTRRRAWSVFAVALVVKAVTLVLFGRLVPHTVVATANVVATVAADLTIAISLVIALNASPGAERRAFRLAGRMWRGSFAPLFFRVAAIGRSQSDAAPRTPTAGPADAGLAPIVPPAVAKRFPDLPVLLRRLEHAHAGLWAREAEVARAVAEAGGERPHAAPRAGTPANATGAPGSTGHATEAALLGRRDALLLDMREALDGTRERRAAVAAALDTVRVQLLRIGAGVGTVDDIGEELATVRALLAEQGDGPARGAATRL